MAALHVYCLLLAMASAAMYDFSNTSVRALTVFNFDEQVNKQRSKLPAIVHFYRERDRMTNNLVDELNALAVDWQGAFVVGAVNCGEQEKLCEDQDVLTTPKLKVYPPLPAPTHEYEAEVSAKRMISYLAGYFSGKVEEVREIDLKHFLDKKTGTPKVLLFTEKTGIPTIYKALSNTLGDTLDFGIVRNDQTSIVSKYSVRTFPTLLIVRGTDTKPQVYKGELKYRHMFEFINIYSEVFVVADEKGAAPVIKPWKSDAVPELHQASAQDVCFSKEGFICAIFLTNTKPTPQEIDLFKGLKEKFTSKLEDRGADVTFMWVNTVEEEEFVSSFEGLKEGLVFLKHGKRNRYLGYTGELTEDGIETALARIMGGDGKFNNIKGKFPTFSRARK